MPEESPSSPSGEIVSGIDVLRGLAGQPSGSATGFDLEDFSPHLTHAYSVESFGLDEKTQAALVELQRRTADVPYNNACRLRFLSFWSCNVETAETKLREMHKWRQSKNADAIIRKLPPQADTMARVMPSLFNKQDKDGRPIYIERTGEFDVQFAAKLMPEQNIVANHLFGFEFQEWRCRRNTVVRGHPVYQSCNILDLAGLTVGHIKALGILKGLAALDDAYYPEMMGRVYLVNAPWAFPAVWKVARVFLSKALKGKIVVLGTDYKERLLQDIDADCLPEEYGGTDPVQVPHVDVDGLSTASCDPDLKEKSLSAGKVLEQALKSGEHGATYSWFFRTVKKDIKFSVQWVPHTQGEQEDSKDGQEGVEGVEVVRCVKVSSHVQPVEGTFSSKGPGELRLKWDNSNSYFSSKVVRYHIACVQNSPEEDRGAGLGATSPTGSDTDLCISAASRQSSRHGSTDGNPLEQAVVH